MLVARQRDRISNNQFITIAIPATLPIVTNTSIPSPTQEIVYTPTLQSTPTIVIEEKCIKIEDQVLSDLQLPRVWVIGEANPYLEDIETGKKIGIPLKGTNVLSSDFEGYAVSPNREWFAYIDQYIDGVEANKRILRIINSSGESLPMDFWSENFQWIIGWADNEHIALELNKTSITHQKIVILNPFSGDYKDITPTWIKDFHDLDPYWIPQIHYSPDASRAVVVADRKFELRDVQTGKILFRGKNVDTLPDLDWSSDSLELAIVENAWKHLYIIGKDEYLLKLESQSFDTSAGFYGVWWSTNGQKLLFGVGGLHFFDLESGKITNLCFDDKSIWTRDIKPLWSPDNRFIVISAIQHHSVSPERSSFNLIVDFKEMRAYKLPIKSIHYERLAWLALP